MTHIPAPPPSPPPVPLEDDLALPDFLRREKKAPPPAN